VEGCIKGCALLLIDSDTNIMLHYLTPQLNVSVSLLTSSQYHILHKMDIRT
jgi:hypothetical protein